MIAFWRFFFGVKTMSRRTQGSMLWAVVKKVADPTKFELMKVGCPLDHKPGTDSKEKIENTCLEEEYNKTYLEGGGLSDTGTATFGLNADPLNASHSRLYDMIDSGESATFIQGWPGKKRGTVKHIVPVVDEDTGEITLSNQRSWTKYTGYVESFPLDFDANTIVKTTVTIQRQSKVDWVRETAEPVPPVGP